MGRRARVPRHCYCSRDRDLSLRRPRGSGGRQRLCARGRAFAIVPETGTCLFEGLADRAIAIDFVRDAAIFGLPLSRFSSSAFEIGAATGTRLSVLSTRPPGKTNLPGMNT